MISLSYSNILGYHILRRVNLPVDHTAQSQSPRSIILRRVNHLPAVSFCGESCDISGSYSIPMRFSTSSFFHHLNLPGPLTNGLNYFRFWICRVNRFFRKNLPSISYCAESISRSIILPHTFKGTMSQ